MSRPLRVFLTVFVLLLCLVLAACQAVTPTDTASDASVVEPDPLVPGTARAVKGYIVVRGFEWGPGVDRVIIELDNAADLVEFDPDVDTVFTTHYDRTVTDIYLSDELGNSAHFSSRYVTIELETSFECTGSPFEQNMTTEHNVWASEYPVTASFRVRANGIWSDVEFSGDCIQNRLCPELDRFSEPQSYTGEYENPLTGETETQTLNYMAYEPDSLDSWEQNPLIIWLHGRGEGGTDITKTVLGNEVSALTENDIQQHFVSGDQVGAYVLVVQCPTYWLDPGNGEEGRGDQDSRYYQILFDTIWAYLESNPDVDPDRIYLMGASNGGFMTVEMITKYPGFFAAGVPISEVFAYYEYAKDEDGNYIKAWDDFIRTDTISITQEDIDTLSSTPLWFVQAANDNLVDPTEFLIPTYQALLRNGATNCWCSFYYNVVGTESKSTEYLGHWSWIYVLNDEVGRVQNRASIASSNDTFLRGFVPSMVGGNRLAGDSNGLYTNLFDWLNAQVRSEDSVIPAEELSENTVSTASGDH